MGELRLILLGLGIVSIGAIWWWTARRSGLAPGNAELRESTAAPAQALGSPAGESARPERRPDGAGAREWGIAPLEPLSIRTVEPLQVPELDRPMSALPDALEPIAAGAPAPERPAPPPGSAAPAPSPPPAPSTPPRIRSGAENGERQAGQAPRTVSASESQKIVTIRVCAVGDARWPGTRLMRALESLGLAYGQYQVYHRNHSDGRSIFCVASLVEPGTFDVASMAEEEFRGVTFFAVLPGPLEPLAAMDAMLGTASDLARELGGIMQDVKGIPLSPQRAAVLREEVARFDLLLR